MKNKPIIISGDGAKIFAAHEAWQDYCIKTHTEDPWKLMRDCENQINKSWDEINEKGHKITHIEFHSKDEWPENLRKKYNDLKKYRDSYMISREIWEGKYILKNFGYNVLTKFAQTHSSSETAPSYDKAFHEWFKKVYPCEGVEKQCNFACPVFNNCPYRDQGIYRNDVNYNALWEKH